MIRAFATPVRREAGYQLNRVQEGFEANDYKPMPSIGTGVNEIRIQSQGQFRIIYVAKFQKAIYALHAFEKKTQKTRKTDIDIAKHAFKALKAKGG